MPTQQASNGDSMPTVPTLTTEVARLTQAVNGWNTAILVMMVVAASAALGLVVTQWKAFKKAEELAAVTSQLSELKESISGAKIEKSAQDAHAATIASIAAQTKALEAETSQRQVELELSKQQEKTALAQKDLLDLQNRLAHRRIGPKVQEAAIASLLRYAGSKVSIQLYGSEDKEVNDLGNDIIAIFNGAKWGIQFEPRSLLGPPESAGIVCYFRGSSAGKAISTVCSAFPNARSLPWSKPRNGLTAAIAILPRQSP